MIPEAAVEAAARAIRDSVQPTQAAIIGPYESSVIQARAAFEAVGPHLHLTESETLLLANALRHYIASGLMCTEDEALAAELLEEL